MKFFEGIKILGLLLMVAIVISFFGCGEDEEEIVKPVNPTENPVAINPQTGTGDTSGPAARIVWVKIEDGRREELVDFEACDQIKHQDTFIAKVLDADGKPVPNARVEWTLNTWPDGVGDIIETDDPGHKDIPAAPQIKVDNKFAITFTNDNDGVPSQLKGMGKDGKDIEIKKGETWITITSTREGDTDVTAFAPAIPRDKTHKIFGLKHWIDLKWEFPKDEKYSINYCDVDANEHSIVTKLTKFSNLNEAVQGVKVRYSILPGGPPIIFKGDDKVVEVISDENGEARATIKLTTLKIDPNDKANKILVEILPVALKRHGEVHPPDGVSGECGVSKEITVTWVGPILHITKEGPMSICLLTNATYTITTSNVGDGDATNITVTDTFDPLYFQFVSADNGGTYANGVVTWKIGDLKPGESKAVHVTLQGIKNGSSPETDNTAKAESVECVNATDVAKTEIVLPDLSIVKTGEPITVLLNEKAIYYITVANTSKCPATKVTITDKFNPDAFQFVSADPPPNPLPPPTDGEVTWNIGDLKPGESKTVSVTLQAIKESPPGSPWKNTATVTCAEWGLTATPPKTAEFETEVRGCVGLNCDKTEVRFGTTEDGRLDGKTIVLEVDETKPNLPVAIITLDVENEGSYNVEGDYELTVTLLPFIELQGEGSPQFIKPSDREISWRITTLKSGDNKFTFEVKGVQAGRDNIVATLSGNPKKLICNPKCEIPIWVVYSCKLPIYAEPFREIKKDETATFTITITNEGKNTASEVTLNIYLCEKLPSGEIICPASPDYVVIVAPLPPYKIGSMKPGDVRTIEVTLKATVTGTYGVKPEVGYICERQGK